MNKITNTIIALSILFFMLSCDQLQNSKSAAANHQFSDQELLNTAVESVNLKVTEKNNITADKLKKEHISATNFDTKYTIEYKKIIPNVPEKKADITIVLKKSTLSSKERTIIITGFKEKPFLPSAITITEEELLSACGIARGELSASAAAKQIAKKKLIPSPLISLEHAELIAYDDAGETFTMHISGEKNGSVFNQDIQVQNWKNPWLHNPQSIIEVQFDFDEAIQNNFSLDKYIEKTQADLKSLSLAFYLFESGKQISCGTTTEYILTAQLEKSNDSIVIKPEYTVFLYSFTRGGTETKVSSKNNSSFSSLTAGLTKKYFTESDVFKYLIKKAQATQVMGEAAEFASEFYALAQYGAAPVIAPLNKILEQAEIQACVEKYKTKEADENLALDIAIAIFKNGSHSANDYDGSLRLSYCIDTEEHIGDQENNQINHFADKTIRGFKKINKETVQDIFPHVLAKSTAYDDTKWKNKSYAAQLLAKTNDSYTINNILSDKTKDCYILVNGKEPSAVFAATDEKLSKGKANVRILVESIYLKKAQGEQKLTLEYTFLGSPDPIQIELSPSGAAGS